MAEVTARKRGSTWSYSFEMAQVNGKQKKRKRRSMDIHKARIIAFGDVGNIQDVFI